MSRALTLHRSIVPLPDRKRYLERLRARRAYFVGASCRFWAFEENDLAGAFIEFVEADDEDTLAAALEKAPEQIIDSGRIYLEVELK
jgi:hypothetical protein